MQIRTLAIDSFVAVCTYTTKLTDWQTRSAPPARASSSPPPYVPTAMSAIVDKKLLRPSRSAYSEAGEDGRQVKT